MHRPYIMNPRLQPSSSCRQNGLLVEQLPRPDSSDSMHSADSLPAEEGGQSTSALRASPSTDSDDNNLLPAPRLPPFAFPPLLPFGGFLPGGPTCPPSFPLPGLNNNSLSNNMNSNMNNNSSLGMEALFAQNPFFKQLQLHFLAGLQQKQQEVLDHKTEEGAAEDAAEQDRLKAEPAAAAPPSPPPAAPRRSKLLIDELLKEKEKRLESSEERPSDSSSASAGTELDDSGWVDLKPLAEQATMDV